MRKELKINFISPQTYSDEGNQLDFKYISKLMNGESESGGFSVMGCIPAALPTIAALTPPDVTMSITDENIEDIDFEISADIVALSFLTASAYRGYEIADEFRKRGVYVVMGGIHVSMIPDEALEHADTIFIGEAEDTWPQFIIDFQEGKPKQIYTCEKKPDLKKLVIPRWDLLNNKFYTTHHIQTTRGCPYDCDFCAVKIYLGNPRYKPVENVIKEIEAIKKYNKSPGRWTIMFSDDNIISSKAYARKLFKALIPLKVHWASQISINIAADDELLALAKESGCENLLIGFESISQESLNSVNKGKLNRADEYKKAIENIHSHGILVLALIILGLDGDTPTIFKEILDFVNETNIAYPVLNILTPVPGTRLFERMIKDERILNMEWDKYNGAHVCYKPLKMSTDTLQQGHTWLLEKLYSEESCLKRIDALYDMGTLKDNKNYRLIRIFFTLILFRERFRQNDEMSQFIKKIIKILWKKKGINIGSIMFFLNFFEFSRGLTPPDDSLFM